jgi:hypothetical protein
MVLRIGESRIGLSRQVAALVHVRPAGDPSSPTTIV